MTRNAIATRQGWFGAKPPEANLFGQQRFPNYFVVGADLGPLFQHRQGDFDSCFGFLHHGSERPHEMVDILLAELVLPTTLGELRSPMQHVVNGSFVSFRHLGDFGDWQTRYLFEADDDPSLPFAKWLAAI